MESEIWYSTKITAGEHHVEKNTKKKGRYCRKTIETAEKPMGNKWIMGHGPTAEFAYKVYEWQTKTSIENQYLNILWHNGLVGLVLLILSYLSILIYSFKNRFHYILKSGETISFNMCVFLTMLTYYVVEFGVQESDMARIYTVFVALLIAYNRIASSKAEVVE